MTLNRVILAGALVAAVGLAGCSSTRQALGMTKVTPDEFRVVTKAPLVVPPDYSLRPPAPGEPQPQELRPESAARAALVGEREGLNRSQGEQALVAKAGLAGADPLIRYVVDDEFGDIAHKDKGFADRVMFWRGDEAPVQPSGPDLSGPVDAEAEQARINAITGGGDVVIRRDASSRIKRCCVLAA